MQVSTQKTWKSLKNAQVEILMKVGGTRNIREGPVKRTSWGNGIIKEAERMNGV